MNNDSYIMWLTRISGLGNVKLRLLLNEFETAKEIFNAPRELLSTFNFLTKSNIISIVNSQNKYIIEKYNDELLQKKVRFISMYNEEYPKLLKEIIDAPIGIYVLGNLPDEAFYKVSVIGSRRCSEYGLTMAYKLSKDLASKGVIIVSGMARGIDSMAHRGAIDADSFTIAVLGCGIDICYPAENRALREQIIKSGCIISEHPPGVKPIPGFFPMRNRIISGLSLATLVVEAAEKSGTLITVEQALEQGRDVLAVPGNATSKLSGGTNRLIKEGACLVSNYTDVLDAIGVTEKNEEIHKYKQLAILAPDEKLVYDCISLEPVDIEFLVNTLNCQFQMVNYICTMLELKGLIMKISGQRYIRSM
jgi:DNA processing protein